MPDGTVQSPYRTIRFEAFWHPSSDYFATTLATFPDSSDTRSLVLFDLQGQVVQHIYQTHEGSQQSFDARGAAWSGDGRYLAFTDDHLYIADLDQQIVMDTCLTARNNSTLAWSPASDQLAAIGLAYEGRIIRIIDLKRAASYVVGYHQGSLIGWRADDTE
jgi:WD40 repeat protein